MATCCAHITSPLGWSNVSSKELNMNQREAKKGVVEDLADQDNLMEDNMEKENVNNESIMSIGTFDISKYRLSQNFTDMVGTKKIINTIPVRKPGRQEFVRTHPEEEYWFQTAVLELKDVGETYIVDGSLWGVIDQELIPKILIPTISRQGVLTLWPVRLPGPDGRHDSWNSSALDAALRAKKSWTRIVSNRSLGAYECYEAQAAIPDPEWPDLSLEEILQIAFKNKSIQNMDDPVLRALRGEV